MTSLRTVIDSLVEEDGTYLVEAPETWSQGRTLYGGITTALCAAAAAREVPDLAPLRAVQVAFVGPASGRIKLEPRVLRRGRSATFIAVDATGEGGPAARATLVYGGDRPSEIGHDSAVGPDVPPPEACDAFFEHAARPAFFQNFELRLAAGARPISKAEDPEFTVWVRHRDAAGVDPVIALLALADCPPPAAMTSFAKAGAISTMTWSLDLFHPIESGDWYLLRSRSEQAANGYSLQAMSLWAPDGRRLAVGRQIVALFL